MDIVFRLFDSYFANLGLINILEDFENQHVYVCCALLMKFSTKLKRLKFIDMIQFLQKLPLDKWTDFDIELLISEVIFL